MLTHHTIFFVIDRPHKIQTMISRGFLGHLIFNKIKKFEPIKIIYFFYFKNRILHYHVGFKYNLMLKDDREYVKEYVCIPGYMLFTFKY